MTTEEKIRDILVAHSIQMLPKGENEPDFYDRASAELAALVESERKAGYEEGYETAHEKAVEAIDEGFEAGARAVAEKFKEKAELRYDFTDENDKGEILSAMGYTILYREFDEILAAVLGKEGE